LASGISACPPGTGKRGLADAQRAIPTTARSPETATGTGALPSQVPVVAVRNAPANGSLGGRTGKGCGAEYPKGISFIQPGVDAQRLRRVVIVK